MSDNPLVAERYDTATALSGASLLDDGVQLAHAVESGDWVEGGVAAFSLAIDTVAAVSDPIGTLIGHGLGWLMDHLKPLKGWLDDLTGDAGEVQAFSQTWANIGKQLTAPARELDRIVHDVQTQRGATMDAYRAYQKRTGEHIAAAAALSSAFSAGLGIASTIVQVVHDLVRDSLSQLVGSIISWAAEAVFSLGLAAPWIVEQISTRIASLTTRLGTKLKALIGSVGHLKVLLSKIESLLGTLRGTFDEGLGGARRAAVSGAGEAPRGAGTSRPHGDPDASHFSIEVGSASSRPREIPDLSDLDDKYRDAAGLIPPDRVDDWAAEVSARFPELSPEQVSAIHDYTTDRYAEYNAFLRGSDHTDAAMRARVELLESGMDRLPSYEGATFRGVSTTPDQMGIPDAGGEWHDASFMSSSTRDNVAGAFGSGTKFTIEGRSGVDVGPLSNYRHEAEILFKPGVSFEVVSKQLTASGWHVHLRER